MILLTDIAICFLGLRMEKVACKHPPVVPALGFDYIMCYTKLSCRIEYMFDIFSYSQLFLAEQSGEGSRGSWVGAHAK
jgi:hypothetical protein